MLRIVALLFVALVVACGTDASAPPASDALVQDDQLIPVTDDGQLWWLFPRNGVNGPGSNDDYIIAASGSGGQWLLIDRTNDLVAVFQSEPGGGSWPSLIYFFGEILPSITSTA